MSENIPIEIQTEIVKRIPVKSLFRFRSVSKSWKSLIDSPRFITDYNTCESRPQHLLIRYLPYTGYKLDLLSIVDDDIFPQHKFATAAPMAESFEYPMELTLVGSSQGLLCLLGEYRYEGYSIRWMVYIWNPAIRKSITIDVSVFHEMYTTVLGFGVCPDTNEPMLVNICNYGLKDVPQTIEVFRLSSRVWRSPRGKLPRKSLKFKSSNVAIDGFIYWLTYDVLIVSFDMISEEFREIKLPLSLAHTSTKDLTISKLRESLVVLEHYKEAEKPVCGVWVMEHGVTKSFTKLYTVTTPNACLKKVLGFRNNGEVILVAKTYQGYEGYDRGVLKVYEPHSQVIKDLGIHGPLLSFFVSSYKETLLLLDQPEGRIYNQRN